MKDDSIHDFRKNIPKEKWPWWWTYKSRCCGADVILNDQKGMVAEIICKKCREYMEAAVPSK